MSILASALDELDNMQLGENNSIEYGWSNKLEEKIVQFNFQLIRINDTTNNKFINYKFFVRTYTPH